MISIGNDQRQAGSITYNKVLTVSRLNTHTTYIIGQPTPGGQPGNGIRTGLNIYVYSMDIMEAHHNTHSVSYEYMYVVCYIWYHCLRLDLQTRTAFLVDSNDLLNHPRNICIMLCYGTITGLYPIIVTWIMNSYKR